MRVALVQLNSSDDPAANLNSTLGYLREASDRGAKFVLTPEVTNCVSTSRSHQENVLATQEHDETLIALRAAAREHAIWLLIGSLDLKTCDSDPRFVNRSFLIRPDGTIADTYDKIHMFDVAVSKEETYRESAGYRPGERAIVSNIGDVGIGMSICYDLRFPHLYRDLAQAGAAILAVPSAFSPTTGAAHWEALLRARAIENGAFVLAPAQCGKHTSVAGQKPRKTYGHSLAVDPWGEVLADGGDMPGVTLVDLDLARVEDCRRRVPSLTHDRVYSDP